MEISTDMKKVKESKCFGIAWDGEVKECKICEVSTLCKQRTLGSVKQAPDTSKPIKKDKSESASSASTMKPSTPRPEPKSKGSEEKEDKKAKTTKKSSDTKKKPEVNYDSDMPDFKPMSIDELLELAKERGLDPSEFDRFTHTNIKKMRITMALKKTYEI